MASGNRDGHPYLYEHDAMTAQIKASENYSQALSKALTTHNGIVDAAVAEYRATLINIMPEEI